MMRSVLLVTLITVGSLTCDYTWAQAVNPSTQPLVDAQYRAALRSWIVRERLLTDYERRTVKDLKLTDQQRAEIDKAHQLIEADLDKLDKMIVEGKTPAREQLLNQESAKANQKVLAALGPQAGDAFINKSPRHDAFQLTQVISSNLLGIGVAPEQFAKVDAILMPVFQEAAKMPQMLPATDAEQAAMGVPFKQALTRAVQQLKDVLSEQQQTALFNAMPFLARLK